MSLKTKTRVRRSQWKIMMTTPTIIDTMNVFNEEPVAVVGEPALNIGIPAVPVSEGPAQQTESVSQVEPVGTNKAPEKTGIPLVVAQEGSSTEENVQAVDIHEEEDTNLSELEPQGPNDDSADEAEVSDNEEDEDDTPPPRHSARIAGGVL
jgi:hypothetical protein